MLEESVLRNRERISPANTSRCITIEIMLIYIAILYPHSAFSSHFWGKTGFFDARLATGNCIYQFYQWRKPLVPFFCVDRIPHVAKLVSRSLDQWNLVILFPLRAYTLGRWSPSSSRADPSSFSFDISICWVDWQYAAFFKSFLRRPGLAGAAHAGLSGTRSPTFDLAPSPPSRSPPPMCRFTGSPRLRLYLSPAFFDYSPLGVLSFWLMVPTGEPSNWSKSILIVFKREISTYWHLDGACRACWIESSLII